MEIERKYLISSLPENFNSYPSKQFEQAYLCVKPVVRVRKEGDAYVLTYKGSGKMVREEYNLPLTAEAYAHLLTKHDGNIITKVRTFIPLENGLTAEVDCFSSPLPGLIMAEVEFPDLDTANAFVPPAWFGKEVTEDPYYHNSNMSRL